MKKIMSSLHVIIMAAVLTACGGGSGQEENVDANSPDVPALDKPKVLVVYFSATGTTKGIAETTAEGMGADIYEIVPQVPYTDADLNWHDNNSRSTIEMNDSSSRPEINGG